MKATVLLHELIERSVERAPTRTALTERGRSLSYSDLFLQVRQFAAGTLGLGIRRGDRVAVYLEKRFETVIACFGSVAAGGVFVPVNPLLKAEQVAYILNDCNVKLLVTSPERLTTLREVLLQCPDLKHIAVVPSANHARVNEPELPGATHEWQDLLSATPSNGIVCIDTDVAAILYTSGSTGKPKGVVLSHRNMVAGAKSVASYLENNENDVILSALPLSFDAGFSQLTTAFRVGARVELLNYLLPRDVINAIERERVTGLTAVPPLYVQLSQLEWPSGVTEHLRYFANTGGRMPLETLNKLRAALPKTKPYLMYGLTEAFRSTYLPPEQVDSRPDSIGKAIPNAEILVLRQDGTRCEFNEPGELVHRGALVGLGYWNDSEKTAERYRPLPSREAGLVLPEIAVFSGDIVRMDEEGYLYFIGRRDEMIKTSGYRVSPTEIEEVLYAVDGVGEVAAFGVPHPAIGEAILVVATTQIEEEVDEAALLTACKERLPAYMVPAKIEIRRQPLPRNPNGKIDRKALASELRNTFVTNTLV